MTDFPKSLADRLKEEIKRNGPVRVDTYMAACLADPLAGYYLTRDPFGATGDFITAPETSQIFGELIGLWVVATWQSMGSPSPFHLIELGPGRGTLMTDALRAMGVVPSIHEAAKCHLVEISPILRERQAQALAAAPCPVEWHTHFSQIEAGPAIVIANEFFDALPIRQFVKQGASWHERLVTVNDTGDFQFQLSHAPITNAPYPLGNISSADDGSIFETREASHDMIAHIANRAAQHPLAALIIDYGFEGQGVGETLQALHEQQYSDPLRAQGETDLTAHVDFDSMTQVASNSGLRALGPISQSRFLLALGLAHRVEKLLANASEDQAGTLVSGAQRLIDPNDMGELFKVLVLTSPNLPSPPPFAPAA